MSNIMGFQLVGGQDLIGDVSGLDDPSCAIIRVEKPAAVGMMGGQNGQMNVGLMPWIPFSEDESFDIPKRNIVVYYVPNEELRNHYNRMFGSGLIVPSKNIIR